MASRVLLALASASALSGLSCSLILSDVPTRSCGGDHAVCEPLNMAQGINTTTACEIWFCRQDTCVKGPRDLDSDTFYPAQCSGMGMVDCDDAVATSKPGGTELCDSADNDCDGVVDEAGDPLPPVPVIPNVSQPAFVTARSFDEPDDDARGATGVFYSSGDMSGAFEVVAGVSAFPEAVEVNFARSADPTAAGFANADVVRGCPSPVERSSGYRFCETSADCASMDGDACVDNMNGFRVCERSCDADTDCRPGQRCLPSQSGVRVCSAVLVADDGMQCTTDAECEMRGLALGRALGPCVTRGPTERRCADAAFCTTNAECEPTTDDPTDADGQLFCTSPHQCEPAHAARCTSDSSCTMLPGGMGRCFMGFCRVPCRTDGTCASDIETCTTETPSGARACVPTRHRNGCRQIIPVRRRCDDDVCSEEQSYCLSAAGSACSLDDAAIDTVGDDKWLVAAVTRSGCASGRLVLGYMTEGTALTASDPGRNVLLRGEARRSTSYMGVDVSVIPMMGGQRESCTGQSRPDGAPLGAAKPRLALLETASGHRKPQALVAYLAGPVCRGEDTCPRDGATGPVGVEIIGAWLESGSAGATRIEWVNATGNAIPSAIGTTRGVGRPAVAATIETEPDGYFVAYSDDTDDLSIRFVGAFPDPPGMSTNPPFDTPLTTTSPLRTTPPITDLIGAPFVIQAGGNPVDAVELALGEVVSQKLRMALAWVESTRIRFVLVEYDIAARTFSNGMPMELGAGNELAVAYVRTGILGENGMQAGQRAGRDGRGGWVVTWRNGMGVYASRISELGVMPVGPTAVRIGGPDYRTPQPFLGADGQLHVMAHDRGGNAFVVFPSLCGPAAQ